MMNLAEIWSEWQQNVAGLLVSMAEGEREVLAHRKELVEASKEAKRVEGEEGRAEANRELLKRFQLAVDFFTNHYKKANAEVQNKLADLAKAENPLLGLEQVTMERNQLLAERDAATETLASQEAALKAAQEELALLKQAQENSRELWRELETLRDERDALEAEKTRLQEAMAEANAQVTQAAIESQELRGQLAQISEAHRKGEEQSAKLLEQKDREIEILMLKAETDRLGLAELVREKRALEEQLAAEKVNATTARRPSAVEEAMRVKDESLGRLLEEAKAEIGKLQAKLQERDQRLASMADYEAMKHQLAMRGDSAMAEDVQGKLLQAEAIVTQLEAVNGEQREAMESLNQRVNDLEGMLRQFDTLATGSVLTSPTHDREHLLVILNNQRERLKRRNEELDERILELNQQVTKHRQELNRAQADNLKLLERIKHLESIAYKKPNFGDGRRLSDVEAGRMAVATAAEAEKDEPFFDSLLGEQLSQKIQAILEKYPPSWSYARIFVSGRLMRRVFLAYLVGIHLLIMYVLIRVG